MLPADADDEQHAGVVQMVCKRMVDRVWFVGSSEQTAPQIEQGFRDAVGRLETHLSDRPYLFGGRPAYADFGLWGQLYNAWTDPTPCNWIEARAPHLLDWIHRMTWPRAEGGFEPWSALEPTLLPFLEEQVGGLFLPWTLANEACVAAGDESFTVELPSGSWTQKPQKYHAKSLAALREKYAAVAEKTALDPVLERAGCLAALRG
jgi:hypothetical protein